jgi:hypothetical protein
MIPPTHQVPVEISDSESGIRNLDNRFQSAGQQNVRDMLFFFFGFMAATLVWLAISLSFLN